MFSFDQYTDVVPLPVLMLAPVLAGMVFLLCPMRLRLPTALILLPPFLIVGGLPKLGPISMGAKALGFAVILAVGIAAMLSPGEKRKLHPICYAYVPLALVAPIFVVTTEEPLFPIFYAIQWIFMVFSAIMLVRTITSGEDLLRIVRYLAFGFMIATPILLSALVTGNWSFTGHSRFEPYGAASVQIGVVFTMAGGLGLYMAFRDPVKILRLAWLGMVAAAAGMGLLSGGRSVMITMIGVCAPVGLYAMRRPALAVPMVGVMLVGIAVVLSQVDSNPFSRFRTLETARGQQAVDYIRESIAQRPMTGLLGTRGLNANVDESLGFHAHNAYLKMAYTGGLVLVTPYLILAGISLAAAVYTWRHRRALDADPLLISVLTMFLIMIYAHGMVNHMIYQATHTWAFLHLMLSMMFITMATEIMKFKREDPALMWALRNRQLAT
ncbi:MAG: O-antigen ligase family protein [Phycisphaerales bacterium JB060]